MVGHRKAAFTFLVIFKTASINEKRMPSELTLPTVRMAMEGRNDTGKFHAGDALTEGAVLEGCVKGTENIVANTNFWSVIIQKLLDVS